MSETEKIYEQTKECDQARAHVTDVIQNLSAVAQQNAASTEEMLAFNASRLVSLAIAVIRLIASCILPTDSFVVRTDAPIF